MGFGPYRGGGGGMGNMQQLMKQAQKMQQDLQNAQEELKELEVTMTCDGKLTGIHIKPEAVNPDDVEMLEDLITAAFNDAMEQVETEKNNRMGQFSGLGLGF